MCHQFIAVKKILEDTIVKLMYVAGLCLSHGVVKSLMLLLMIYLEFHRKLHLYPLGLEEFLVKQVAMEQIMACGLGACYICVRTFEVNGEKILRRVCREGPVFDIQETVGW